LKGGRITRYSNNDAQSLQTSARGGDVYALIIMKDKIKTGDIFKFQNEYVAEVIRVFCFNKKQVMYEFWYEDIESWSMINEKTCIFFRMPRGLFNKFSTIIDSSNWTDSDLKKIRPDLPLEIAVNSSCKWSLPIGKFNYELKFRTLV